MLLSNLIKKIEADLPPETAMDYDKLGLQVQSGNNLIKKLLIALEVNEEVIDEASEKGCDSILVFHPLIFRPMISVSENDRTGKLVTKLIKNSISLISAHTNFDAFPEGTSKILADKLKLRKEAFLVPDKKYDNRGMGIIAYPDEILKIDSLLEKVHQICNGSLRYTIGNTKSIKKIAIVGGSGSSFIDDAIKSGADAFITADISYHNYHRAKGILSLIDPGHYEMEQFVPQGLLSLVKSIAGNEIDAELSQVLTNPVDYYPDNNYRSKQKQYLLNN